VQKILNPNGKVILFLMQLDIEGMMTLRFPVGAVYTLVFYGKLNMNIFAAMAVSAANPATSDQLKQWILANRNSMPAGAEQAIAAANTDGDLASTILRIFGLGKQQPTESATVAGPRNSGVKVGERDGEFFDEINLIGRIFFVSIFHFIRTKMNFHAICRIVVF
jgi:hypothetical protein